VDKDPTLIEDGMASRVVLATPTTLIALLLSVAYGWRQEQLAENAQRISEAGRVVHERMAKLIGFLARFGGQINSLTACYNEAVGSLESRLLPAARRLEELGAGSEKSIPVLEPVDLVPGRWRSRRVPSSGGGVAPSLWPGYDGRGLSASRGRPGEEPA